MGMGEKQQPLQLGGGGVYILHSQKLAVMLVKVRDSLKKCITYILEQKLAVDTEKLAVGPEYA